MHSLPSDFNGNHPGIRNLGRIQLGPLPQALSEGCSQCSSIISKLSKGRVCFQACSVVVGRTWIFIECGRQPHTAPCQVILHPLREATQKEPERSQQDGVRTLYNLVSEVVGTTLADFGWAVSHCSSHTQWTEVTQGHVQQGRVIGSHVRGHLQDSFSSFTIFKVSRPRAVPSQRTHPQSWLMLLPLGSPGSLFVLCQWLICSSFEHQFKCHLL